MTQMSCVSFGANTDAVGREKLREVSCLNSSKPPRTSISSFALVMVLSPSWKVNCLILAGPTPLLVMLYFTVRIPSRSLEEILVLRNGQTDPSIWEAMIFCCCAMISCWSLRIVVCLMETKIAPRLIIKARADKRSDLSNLEDCCFGGILGQF